MPNDAKLGLVLGIGLVVVIGMVFFRTEPATRGANLPSMTNGTSAQSPESQDTSP